MLYGIGVSVQDDMDLTIFRNTKNIVFHTINGITNKEIYEKLRKINAKILILGYKDFGFGNNYRENFDADIKEKQKYVEDNIIKWINEEGFKLISFDNLALEQLKMKEKTPKKIWEMIYRGDEGNHTYFIDLVSETFALNSISKKHYPLTEDMDVYDAFQIIQKERKNN